MEEIWRSIPNFDDYEVSTLGRVRSWRIKGNTTKPVDKPRLLKEFPSGFKQRYVSVKLYKNNKGHSVSVHRLVGETFLGPKPEGLETRHLDGNPHNNRLDNLAYGTHQENVLDQIVHGTAVHFQGESHPRAKLTEQQVLEIRQRYADGTTQTALAKQYCVDSSTISLIVLRKKWKHI